MTLMTRHFGVDIPRLGFGTWKLKGETARHGVHEAIRAGYRLIDTAQAYENEAEVGRAISAGLTPRDELFVTTKIWMSAFADGDLQASARASLERLGLDHVDLMLLHWPNPEVALEETIAALNEVREAGLTRHIGVSNFTTRLLDEARRLSRAPILVNQVEFHPFIEQSALLEACHGGGHGLMAYSPLAQGKVFGEPILQEIARVHGKNEAQVTLRWMLQKPDIIAIPRSSSPEHILSNADIFDFELSPDEMGRIGSLKRHHDRLIDPSWAPEWDPMA
ncbi:MAG: aldo/keto reductase [Alphaproteobacteria bacterium]|jgi:diketogulonate reductase-like aldo/keto reductase|nr:aldo/keto reductase [Alphaproteobacteria bacterium]